MTEAELLGAVLRAPDDDGPRIVYGDWLLEQSSKAQRARGEFIQVQCALARMPDEPSPERTELVRREAALLAEYELKWIDAAIPEDLPRRRRWDSLHNEWTFERGFVADYSKTQRADDIGPHLGDIFAKIPLVNLHVWVFRDSLGDLLDAPGLEQLKTVTIEFSGDGTQAPPHALFASKRFRSLTDLRFGWLDAGSAPPLAELLAAPMMERVERFAVDWYQEVDDPADLHDIVKTLASSALRERLTHLTLKNLTLGKRALALLCKTTWPRLRHLELECDDVGIATLPIAKSLTALEGVALKMGHGPPISVKPQDAVTLLRSLPVLRSLAIEGMRDFAIDKLVARPEAARLRSLSLRMCRLPDEAALAIAAAKHLALRELDLSYNAITSKGSTALAKAAHLASLRHLDLSHCKSIGVAAFTKSPHVEGLQRLDLRGIPLNKAADALRDRLGATALIAEDDDPKTRRKR